MTTRLNWKFCRYPVLIGTQKIADPWSRDSPQLTSTHFEHSDNLDNIKLILHDFDLNFGTVVMWENWVWWERSEAATEARRKSKRSNKKCLLRKKTVESFDYLHQFSGPVSWYSITDTNRFFFLRYKTDL